MTEQIEQPLKRPTTTEQFAAEIRASAVGGTRVLVQGSASMAPAPLAGVQPISTLRLNKIVEHAVADMTVIVQAGITLEALQRELAWRDQWLPIDPPAVGGRAPGNRTIGGLIATNSLGPLRFAGAEGGGGGDWRLLIMGMKWIDATGTLIAGGGRTMKNVAGYATHRLHIGACGSLGAIAEVALRTFARPADEQSVILFCTSAAEADAVVGEVLLAPVTPAYVQIVGGSTFAANPLQLPAPVEKAAGSMAVIVGFLGRPAVCAGQIEKVRTLPAARALESIAQTAAQAGRLRLWMTSEPAIVENGVGFRLHVRSSQVAEAVAQLDRVAPGAWIISEAATGVIRGAIQGVGPAEKIEACARAMSGTIVATQGFWPTRRTASEIERRLKHALDPGGIFGGDLR